MDVEPEPTKHIKLNDLVDPKHHRLSISSRESAQGSTPDDKEWALSILTSIVAGSVGYLFGKSSKP